MAFSVRPLVSWPKKAAAGRRYLMTIDVEPADPAEPWPYEAEEIAIHCMIDTGRMFTSEVVDDTAVVMHRFGGTYGPVRYILTAANRSMAGAIHLALLNEHGVPFKSYKLQGVHIVGRETREKRATIGSRPRRPVAAPARGDGLAKVIRGRLVTFDAQQHVLDRGALYIDADGTIAAIKTDKDPAPAGFSSAPVIDVEGVVYPGLVDLENHIAYSTIPLWRPPDRTVPFTSRYQWGQNRSYKPMITDPARALGAVAGLELFRYGEAKALVGGTTTMQGSPRLGRPFEGWLVRQTAFETVREGKRVYHSILQPRKAADYQQMAERMRSGAPWIHNVAEGTDPVLKKEFQTLLEADCIQPMFVGVHAVALGPSELAIWGSLGGSLVWCPFANLWLYGQTADVAAAKQAGIRLCLGTNWSPAGSKNLLGELKVADLVNERLNRMFSDRELCEMVTSAPADALHWQDKIGRLRAGAHADLLMVADRHNDPYRNLIMAVEEDVLLVVVQGQPHYGEFELLRAAGAPRAEQMQVGSVSRAIDTTVLGNASQTPTWSAVLAGIERARADPLGRYLELERARGGSDPPEVPAWIRPSASEGPNGDNEELSAAVNIPPPDPLAYDAAFFQRVAENPMHGGSLMGLADYYGEGHAERARRTPPP
jgi:cytosine/adenosine deaminase-related metal-dependent hydrolase